MNPSLARFLPPSIRGWIRSSDFLACILFPLSRFNGRILQSRLKASGALEEIPRLARYRGCPPIGGLFDLSLSQIDSEILEVVALFQSQKPTTVCEIGTAWGGSLLVWSAVCPEEATIVSIDLPGGPFGAGYPKYRRSFYSTFAKKGQTMHLLRRDSHSPTTLREVERILGGRGLDFLFIDGDHTYAGVKQDFEMYQKLVNRGRGIIAVHDIAPVGITRHDDPSGTADVARFWAEIKPNYMTRDIMAEAGQRGFGIGLVFM